MVLQRDWLVIVANANAAEHDKNDKAATSQALTNINSTLTFIDQFANCISAIPTLVLWDLTSVNFICLFVVGYNLVGCIVEILIMIRLATES